MDSDERSTSTIQACEGGINPLYEESGQERRYKYIYFYYLTARESGPLDHSEFDTRTYFLSFPQPVGMNPARVHALVASADLGLISPVGWRVADLRWRKKAHLVFVLRDPENTLEVCDAVRFEESTTRQNFSFRDGSDIEPVGPISGMYCANIRKNKLGGDIAQGDDEGYEITINSGVAHNSHRDNGQNTGP